ncbi:hypothetical protein, partial [Klebsiella quasipneumoniae]|uniref:hypothetical protein n=1 Tax=Klebsiella quasipneumoniae TaxID=1463165 RepID=UPI0034D413FB
CALSCLDGITFWPNVTVANPQQYQSKPPVSRVKKDATLRPFFHGFACRPATADSKYSSKCHSLETVR